MKRKKKILILIAPPFLTHEALELAVYMNRQTPLPYGALSLATYLTNSGHEVKVVPVQAYFTDTPEGFPVYKKEGSEIAFAYALKDILEDIVNTFKPDIVGISAHGAYLEYSTTLMIRILKKVFPEIKIIIGGQLPSFTTRQWFENECCPDAVVVGEGEKTTLELIEKDFSNMEGIPGIAYFNGEMRYTGERPFMSEEEISFPIRYEPLSLPENVIFKDLWPLVIYGRGCVYKCNFCTAAAFWKEKLRFKTPRVFKMDVENLIHKGFQFIELGDETINASRKDFIKLCDALEEYDGISFQASTRVDKVNVADLKRMKKAHFDSVYIGIESIDKEVLKAMDKNLGGLEPEEICKMIKEEGMKVGVFILIGHPGASKESDMKTAEWLKKMWDKGYIDDFCLNFFTPHPGSKARNDKRLRIVEKNTSLWTNQYPVHDLVDEGGSVYYSRDDMTDLFLEMTKFIKRNKVLVSPKRS